MPGPVHRTPPDAGSAARAQLNRVLLVAVLPLALSGIALGGLGRRDGGAARAAWWVRVVGRLTGVTFESRGEVGEAPGGWRILVANHSSLLDIPALIATRPGTRFVAGADLFRIPFLAAAMRSLGTVAVDRRSAHGAHLELPADAPPGDLAVFPEGRLAPAGTRLPFHRGAFAVAIAAGAPVVPVAIHRSAGALPAGARMALRPGRVVVEYLPPISTAGLDPDDRHALAEQAERAILEALDPADGGRAPTAG